MYKLDQKFAEEYGQRVFLPAQNIETGVIVTALVLIVITNFFVLWGHKKGVWKLSKPAAFLTYASFVAQFVFCVSLIFDYLWRFVKFPDPSGFVSLGIFLVGLLGPLVLFIFHTAWRTDIPLRLRYAIFLSYSILLAAGTFALGAGIFIFYLMRAFAPQ